MSTSLMARDLTVGYRVKGQPERAVASNLSLTLSAGEFVCLLGPNGVGKSTLIRTLAGMQAPLSGRISIADTILDDMGPKQRARAVSVVLTDSLPSGMFDAYSMVALGRHPHTGWAGNLNARDRERISWALSAVGAEALAARQVSELSDGERQKVIIARALAQETSLILLDEPTAFLDLPRRVELMRTLRDLARREGLSILLSTHDLDLALRSADTLWLLDVEGNITSGMPEALALGGSIASAFASNEVDWDSEHGSFRMHCSGVFQIALEGGGERATWTRRALSRIGYEVLAAGEEAALRVQVVEEASGPVWLVCGLEGRKRFSSLEALIEELRNREA